MRLISILLIVFSTPLFCVSGQTDEDYIYIDFHGVAYPDEGSVHSFRADNNTVYFYRKKGNVVQHYFKIVQDGYSFSLNLGDTIVNRKSPEWMVNFPSIGDSGKMQLPFEQIADRLLDLNDVYKHVFLIISDTSGQNSAIVEVDHYYVIDTVDYSSLYIYFYDHPYTDVLDDGSYRIDNRDNYISHTFKYTSGNHIDTVTLDYLQNFDVKTPEWVADYPNSLRVGKVDLLALGRAFQQYRGVLGNLYDEIFLVFPTSFKDKFIIKQVNHSPYRKHSSGYGKDSSFFFKDR